MFRHFSFEPASRPPSLDDDADRLAMNLSPTEPALPFNPPPPPASLPCDLGDLAQKLDEDLRVELDPAYDIPCCQPLARPQDTFPFQHSYSRLTTATLRMQRQANTRMQCSSSHAKDLSLLVQKMIDDEEQCRIGDTKLRPPLSPTTSDDDDEGVDMDYEPSTPEELRQYRLNFRRSGDRLDGCTMVARSVRMRKKSRVTKRSSK
ncbi:hypothetical protein BS50DRAFT_676576 [Corynespora cassiicola Philippines]|uniref:Uncharacterized protein n=1 Tax=Corynespora cassiicola Philippines TaxID=1448308 RepID=A0A2T2NNM3_CORCC|nr:hypothetical protein BS50DRAFT_676576 [Corynespora cassiicola Philippines]